MASGRRRRYGYFRAFISGPIFLVGSIALLIWNEGNSISEHRALDEGARATISVENTGIVQPENEGKLVHLIGLADAKGRIADEPLGVSPSYPVLKLRRDAEMYQWVDGNSDDSQGSGSKERSTRPAYTKKWVSRLIDSSKFDKPTGHQNPGYFPYPPTAIRANPITLGAFSLSEVVTDLMNWYTTFGDALSTDSIADATTRAKAHVMDGGFYIGENPSIPTVGDMRISYKVVSPQTVSIVAQQVGNSFAAYPTRAGRTVLLLMRGPHSPQEMFQNAQDDATAQAWAIRIIGTFLLYISLLLLLRPITALAETVPVLGFLVGGATACVMLPIALVLASAVIALSWLAYRPLWAAPFLLLLALSVYFLARRRSQTASQHIPVARVIMDHDNELEFGVSHVQHVVAVASPVK